MLSSGGRARRDRLSRTRRRRSYLHLTSRVTLASVGRALPSLPPDARARPSKQPAGTLSTAAFICGLALRACHEPRSSQGKGSNPHDAHDREHRHRGLRRSGWQHELEEGHGIAPLGLHRPDGAITVANDQRRSLDTQEGDTRPQSTTPPSRQHRDPDIAQAPELCHGPGSMQDAPCPSSTAKCRPAHHRMR
jgi:hypothetical protein